MSGQRKSKKSSHRGRPRRTIRKKRSNVQTTSRFFQPSHVFLNGNVLTMDPTHPVAEAIAILDDKIVATGTSETIANLAGPSTRVTDLQGATVLPGFIDCHNHLIWHGITLGHINLHEVHSIPEMKRLVAERADGSDKWIHGDGWDQEKFTEKRYPTKHDLDDVSPNNPVLLRRVCGHICVVNSAALKAADVTTQTLDPAGGIIDRDAAGEPTGILREKAVELVELVLPHLPGEDFERATLAASEIALRAGITSVHCITSSQSELRALLNLKAAGKLKLRFYVFIPADQMKIAQQAGIRSGLGDEWVRIGGVKIFTDGSLGARTAALHEPYADDTRNRGVTIYNQEELDKLVHEAHSSDFQIAAHAIGDRAVGMALSAFEKAQSQIPKKELRHRIEHASVLNPELIKRFAASGIIASIQPHFIVSDFWTEQRLGTARALFAYPFSSLLRAGIRTVAGSDCPFDLLPPLAGTAAAVDRPGSSEAVSVEMAIAFYSRDAAYASFEENVKGTISPGKYADLVILDEDPRKVLPSRIPDMRVLMTVVGGRVAYYSDARFMP